MKRVGLASSEFADKENEILFGFGQASEGEKK
jgi:hypothetical protein